MLPLRGSVNPPPPPPSALCLESMPFGVAWRGVPAWRACLICWCVAKCQRLSQTVFVQLLLVVGALACLDTLLKG